VLLLLVRCFDSAVLFEFADWLKENDPATAPKNTKVTKRGRGRTKQAAPPSIKPLAKPVSRKRKGRHAAEDEEDMEVEEAVSRATEKTSRRPSKRTAESQSAAQEAAAAQEVPEDGRGEEERVAAGQRHAGHVEEGHSREVSQ
jgi:type IV secretory pathway VirB10-like protein